MVVPTVARSQADLAAPFVDGGNFAELAIEQLEVFSAEDRIWGQFEARGDARAFGEQWAAFARASVFPTMAAALDGGRDTSRSTHFFDRLEADVTARLARAPNQMLIPLAKIRLKKGD
jgi:hypothetical protein